jgi:hypothetical protein
LVDRLEIQTVPSKDEHSVAYSGVSRANSTAGSWAYVMEAQTESTWVEKMGASMAVCLGCKSARKLVE